MEGIISLKKLVISDDDAIIGDLMLREFVEINVYEDQESVSEKFMKYGFLDWWES